MAAVEVATKPPVEVFSWLKSLPLAPEYHPTLAEFQDPIAYILRIEKEASEYGICKIVPPVQPLPKKTLIANLNRSLAARNPSSSSKSAPAFATRQQGIGFCPRKPRPVQKPVWQSGETYTLQQFEEKAKQFEKSYLRRISKKNLSALEIETLFWKACADKPFSVEYANDMPGSAFAPVNEKKWRDAGEASTVGETPWNMRVVSRAKGSLLRFMKEEISGVTSPMLYIAMLFSWLAWHVEDHDLHGLNYLHMGAGKTWYGVPREAAVAFEEVIRVHGYGGEVNPLVTFSILSEKTTVMSPEVLINARIPCCRLVQNAGEYVVTFPRAYHSGFSHANIATPEWLQVAKEAAIRRASINYPPLLSHYQLLYSFALTSCSRLPLSICTEPRSSRLKDKKRSEGETMVKGLFVQNVMQNNELLHVLGKGSSCIILPLNFLGISVYSELHGGSQSKVRHRFPLGLCSLEKALESSKSVLSNNTRQDRSLRYLGASTSVKGTSASVYERDKLLLLCGISNLFRSTAEIQSTDSESESLCDGLLDHGFFSCVMCGILSFACVAVVQPKPAASHYLMSTNCSFFNEWIVDTEINSNRHDAASGTMDIIELNSCLDSECEPTCPDTGRMVKSIEDGLYDVPVHSGDYQVQVVDQVVEIHSDNEAQNGISSLELLAFAYGDPSDSEEGRVETELSASAGDSLRACSLACDEYEQYRSACEVLPSKTSCLHDDSSWTSLGPGHDQRAANIKDRSEQTIELENLVPMESKKLEDACRDTIAVSRGTPARSAGTRHSDSVRERIECNPADCSIPSSSPSTVSNCSSISRFAETTNFIDAEISVENTSRSVRQRSIENSCGMHMFCLEHAMEVEKQLRPIGGVHMLLLCHPDYAKVEAEAKSLAEDLGINYIWNDIPFKDATKEDLERIQSGIYNEEALHGTEDWTVKLGINLYYSARLSRSPLCSKQMPYNAVIYNAFGRSFPANSLTKPKVSRRGHGKKKKKIVAGKWCGRVWMSNQVHPYLAQRNNQEHEHVGNFRTQATSDEKRGREPNNNLHAEELVLSEDDSPCIASTATKKRGRKRKKTPGMGSKRKLKCPQTKEPSEALHDSPESSSPLQYARFLRSGKRKQEITHRHSSSDKKSRGNDSYNKNETESGPITRLRKRSSKPTEDVKVKMLNEKQADKRKLKKGSARKMGAVIMDEGAEHQCDMDGCSMSFGSKQELALHKRNICSVKGCGKKFFSHKYLVQHRRVHIDDRPLKCPWKGCKMTFKWAWARTEHIRVHTGARPYVCHEAGCGQTFRFVSDFSRHKRKTGHSVKKSR